jgi:anti-anti-sigma factor
MKIKQHRREGVPVIELHGKLEGGPDNEKLLDIISKLAEDGELEAVVKLNKVPFISSTGLGILIRARSRFLPHGGVLRMCELTGRHLSLLAITQTQLLFEVYETEKDALEAANAPT